MEEGEGFAQGNIGDQIDPEGLGDANAQENLGGLGEQAVLLGLGPGDLNQVFQAGIDPQGAPTITLERQSSDPSVESMMAAFQQQAIQLENLKIEFKARKEASMDTQQYEQLLEVQKVAVSALREQKVKLVLDEMGNKMSKRLMGNLLKGIHLVEDLNNLWSSVFSKEDEIEPVKVTNIAEVNSAFKKQSKLLESFSSWMVEERTYIEAANYSKEGWATAEAMKKGTGVFSNADEDSTKRMREAEILVRREKAAALKKSLSGNKSTSRGYNNPKRGYDYSGAYRKSKNKFQTADEMKEIVSNLKRIGNFDRGETSERKYPPYRAERNKERTEGGTTCYKCWEKGHITPNCPKKLN